MSPEPSLISPIGYSASSCGYCSPSGQRSKHKSSYSYGFWATQLSIEMYELLMNRGWRRSGSYVYHPDMARTCCPQYTIRLEAALFAKPGKHQRRTLSKFNRLILTGAQEHGAGTPHPAFPKSRPGRGRHNTPFNLLDQLRLAEHSTPHASTSTLPPGDPSPLSSSTPKPRTFKVTFHSSSPPHPATHPLYVKYQTRIHHDPPPASLAKSFDSFSRFLCSSPLSRPPVRYSHPSLASLQPGSSAWKKKVGEMGLPETYGTWHQLYWVDGELVAFGVLDIVKGGVSSVYFVYDPEGEMGSMGWGKLSALREIGLVKAMAEAGVEDMQHLYMGFYIQSCTKMRYKAQFRPSTLLDPETNLFHPLDPLVPHLEHHRTGYFPFATPPPLPASPPPEGSDAKKAKLTPEPTKDDEGEWVDDDPAPAGSDVDESEDEAEDDRSLPTSPPPPSFLDTRTISKAVLAKVPTYLPGRGYCDFSSTPHARSRTDVAALKELVAALHGLGGASGLEGRVLSGEDDVVDKLGLVLVAFGG